MGLIVLFFSAPVLIPLLIIAIILGLKGDEWFNHAPPHAKGRSVSIFDEDGEFVDSYIDKSGYFDDDSDDFDDKTFEHDVHASHPLDFMEGIIGKENMVLLMEDDDFRDEFCE